DDIMERIEHAERSILLLEEFPMRLHGRSPAADGRFSLDLASGLADEWKGRFSVHFFASAAGGARTGIGTLHRSILPAGTLYQSSRRLRRDSTRSVKVAVSVRMISRLVRSPAGTSAASRTDLIGICCSG